MQKTLRAKTMDINLKQTITTTLRSGNFGRNEDEVSEEQELFDALREEIDKELFSDLCKKLPSDAYK